MADLTVYGVKNSRTARTLWLLEELGCPYRHVPVSWDGEAQSAEHRARNPNGRVPAIDADGFVLWESMAINLHLAREYGGPLAPKTPEEDALCLQWSFWVVAECEVWMERVMGTAARGLRPEDAKVRERALEKLERPLDAIELSLEGRDYLAADRFTVADLNVASVFAWAKQGQLDLASRPSTEAWLHRCLTRPKAVLDADPASWKDWS